MPTCQNCQARWNWKQTMKATFTGRIKCPYCQERQYQTMKSRLASSLFVGGIILTNFALITFTKISLFAIFSIFILLITAYILLHPFMVRVSQENVFEIR